MGDIGYLMESDAEPLRLEKKTDPRLVEQQARWAGVAPGMRVVDIGCGSGKTTHVLNTVAAPGGDVLGVDIAKSRIDYATARYGGSGVRFALRDVRHPLDDLGRFDMVWVRFLLEYYRLESPAIVENVAGLLPSGGTLVLIDLDHNCLNHYGIPPRLERSLFGAMKHLEECANFDPYAGRKLYSYLYDLGFANIEVRVSAHHLIYGDLKEADEFNWTKKVEIAGKHSGYAFPEYPDGYDGFFTEFQSFFKSPRRFTYTPVVCCKGTKP